MVNPDDIIKEMGADALRLYEMFMGAFDQTKPWSTQGARGARRFLERVWRLQGMIEGNGLRPETEAAVHSMIKKVSEDYERMKYNTAIACMMSFVNQLYQLESVTREELRLLIILLNPVAPHITEEIWERAELGKEPVYKQKWPQYDPDLIKQDTVEYAVQVSGRIRARIQAPAEADEEEIKEAAMSCAEVEPWLKGKTVKKVIVVKGQIGKYSRCIIA